MPEPTTSTDGVTPYPMPDVPGARNLIPRTVRIEIDLNVRIRGRQTYAGLEHVTPPDAPLVPGRRVIAYERESGLHGNATVTEVDQERRLVYLAVDWQSMTTSAALLGEGSG